MTLQISWYNFLNEGAFKTSKNNIFITLISLHPSPSLLLSFFAAIQSSEPSSFLSFFEHGSTPTPCPRDEHLVLYSEAFTLWIQLIPASRSLPPPRISLLLMPVSTPLQQPQNEMIQFQVLASRRITMAGQSLNLRNGKLQSFTSTILFS